jgi:predicted GIY-YIG superfamily endonuclease
MKTCSKCNQVKPYDGFYKDKTMEDGYCLQCKSCKKHYNQQRKQKEKISYVNFNYYHSQILPYWIVYELPNANNYIGHTNNPINRMSQHKNVHKRNIEGWIELARFDNKQDALLFEYKKRMLTSNICHV